MTENEKNWEAEPRRSIRRLNIIGLTALAVSFCGIGGWAATARISGAVISPGTLVVESNIKRIQHNTGGIVRELLVHEGDSVQAGQILIKLDDTLARATLGIVQSQLDQFMARQARLDAERDDAEKIIFPSALLDRMSDQTVANAVNGEKTIFEARHRARTGQREQLQERIVQTQNEISGLNAQQEAKTREIDFINEELKGVNKQKKKNLVTIMRYMALQRDHARLQGERAQSIAEIARAKARIAETELQILQVDKDFRNEVLRDLREAEAKVAELQERVNAANDELRRIDIRSPLAGFVHQLMVHTIGGVIGKGETIMQIVPRNDTLIVEAKIAPNDIDQIKLAAPVRVQLAVGDRRTLPDLEGHVMLISADLVHEQQNANGQTTSQAYYLIRVSLADKEVERLAGLKLVSGMPAEVYVRTNDRTPLQYLIKPLEDQLARTFRER
ncbi:MAG: HlyD family type I secretion periplasmic adaptor subunit [Rhizobiales bacterium]|nr:HlyD family type I secretion periplasmic adaptor subunit [Hyphomicrobiales bacterium]